MDTQLSKFWRSRVTATHNHLNLAAHPPCHWHGFEQTGRTKRMEPSSVQSASSLPAGGSSAAPLGGRMVHNTALNSHDYIEQRKEQIDGHQ
jgi:hypothetical protein